MKWVMTEKAELAHMQNVQELGVDDREGLI